MGAGRFGARAGAAAFLLGLSLSGPQALGVATADDTAAPSASTADHNARTFVGTRAATRGTGASRPRTPVTVAPPAAAQRVSAPAAPAGPAAGSGRSLRGDRTAAAVVSKAPPPRPVAVNTNDAPAAAVSDVSTPQPVQIDAPSGAAFAPAQTSAAAATPGPTAQRVPTARTAAATAAIATAGIPVGKAISFASVTDAGPLGQIQAFFEGIGLLIRRTFFNKAPMVSPVQTSGQVAGPITGTIGATDPEDDPLSYSVTSAPQAGSVSISSDGTYTYTPGSGFTGLDGFTVAVTDGGFHINLLDLFRPPSTQAYTQVAQNPNGSPLTFAFIYGSGSQFWSTEARNALQSAAYTLASNVLAASPVTITYSVTAFSNSLDGTLASAGSELPASATPGFYPTIVQKKIQTGLDANGSAVDGQIDWNFGPQWGYGSVSGGQYDFTSTAMHELMHTFGFLSYIDPAYPSDTQWPTFDRFVVAAGGAPVINPSNYQWNGAYSNLYFNGPNAVAVYGGLIPLYSPSQYEAGSSISHLRDSVFVGANEKIMNAAVSAGPGVRILSPLEKAILQDLGYTLNTQAVFVIAGMGFIRRRRNGR